jgi:hypothetical protein
MVTVIKCVHEGPYFFKIIQKIKKQDGSSIQRKQTSNRKIDDEREVRAVTRVNPTKS